MAGLSRGLSRRLVLAELSNGHAVSQPDLVARTGLSRVTVAAVTRDLEREGRIARAGKAAVSRGRPAELLSLRPAAGYVGAAELDHAHLTVAVASQDGGVVAERRVEFDADDSGRASIDAAALELHQLMSEHDIDALDAVVLGVPGPLERRADGTIRSGGVMDGWTDVQPLKRFQSKFGSEIPVAIDNDAHLGAVGEHAFGAAKGRSTALYIKIGAGIGAGIIIDNLLYRGGRGAAGEIGHVRVVDHGELCRCGGRGCLETIASTAFALASLRAVHGTDLTMGMVIELLARGDRSAVRMFEDMGESIGRVVAGTVSALDPEVVVVGSPVLGSSPLTAAVESSLARHTQPFVALNTRIVAGALGERAPLMGAVARASVLAKVKAAR
jgi:predicted NBD/HSP70 family sugar kinase